MSKTSIEGGRFHYNKNKIMLWFGAALVLGGLAHQAADNVPVLSQARAILTGVAESEEPATDTEVGPRLAR